MGRQTPAKVTRLAAGGEPLDAAVAAFLTERDLAPSSHRVYVFTLARLTDHLGPETPVEQVSPRMLAEFMAARYPHLAAASWNRVVATLGSFFAYTTRQGWTPTSPAVGLERHRHRLDRDAHARSRAIPAADLLAFLRAKHPGWADEHLHRFVIHGREYGISYPGGVGFRDNPGGSRWPASACAPANGSATTMTSSTAGATTSGSSSSSRPNPAAATRSARAVGGPAHPRTAAARGRSWTCVSATACRSSPPAPPTCSGNSSTPPMMSMATTPSTGSPHVGVSSPSCSGG